MSTNGKTIGQGARLLVDVGPAAVFMISYNIANRVLDEGAIYWSTGLFMAATAIALAYAAISQKRFPPMLVVTFVIVTLFGAMTIYLQDPIFIFIKPTIINLLFAFTILFSFAFGFNVWKALFSSVFEMPERIWTILAIRWALFFIFLAAVNEVLWRHITDSVVVDSARMFDWLNLTEAFWVNFRLLGTYPIFAVFVALNIPITLKWARAPGEGDDEDQGEGGEGEPAADAGTAAGEPAR
ncbi:MAG TPA: intracellular septation protein A [Oceanicaulis sp.]|uniref:Inner membrane-spanning protein YciB n=1 Tax=Glycocaulis albus TaxID=1382801 RepID=A0ABQ1XJX5_9PROT|nr:septation protein IspZ [Glycocaulis albus]GGG95721.1 putative intracellular septation protein A [Glycocaulis albus]HCY56430.1 intracellular septation protein A [Oceanicaulis sp.]